MALPETSVSGGRLAMLHGAFEGARLMDKASGLPAVLANFMVIGSLLLIFSEVMRFAVVQCFGVLYFYLLYALSLSIYLLSTTVFIFTLIFNFVKRKKSHLYPLVFAITVGVIIYLVPIYKISLQYEFYENLNERTKMVNDVILNKQNLKRHLNHEMTYLVDEKYAGLSNGDFFLFDDSGNNYKILFYIERHVGDNFSGYMYRSDLSLPDKDDFGGDIINIVQMYPHWFYVEFT